MPTARYDTSAIHIPKLGDLVVGGHDGDSWVCNAELLRTGPPGAESERTWHTINPMLFTCSRNCGAHYQQKVIVASPKGIQMLSLPLDQPGQWTELRKDFRYHDDLPSFSSVFVFNEELCFTGNFSTQLVCFIFCVE